METSRGFTEGGEYQGSSGQMTFNPLYRLGFTRSPPEPAALFSEMIRKPACVQAVLRWCGRRSKSASWERLFGAGQIPDFRFAQSGVQLNLSDALERLRILLPPPHVDIGAIENHCRCTFVKRAQRARGRADDQRFVGEFLSFGHQGICADQTAAPDVCAIEHHRAHPDEAVGSNAAAMQNNVMADDAVLADYNGKARVGVQSGIILNL